MSESAVKLGSDATAILRPVIPKPGDLRQSYVKPDGTLYG
jgi:hypothetical protein